MNLLFNSYCGQTSKRALVPKSNGGGEKWRGLGADCPRPDPLPVPLPVPNPTHYHHPLYKPSKVYTRQPTLRPDRADRWLQPAAAHRGSRPSAHYCPAAARLSSGSLADIFWLPMKILCSKCEWREFFYAAIVQLPYSLA